MATEFSPFCSKKMNNGIHWISLYPLVNAIGFPTPGIWPLNLPGEPSWRERHSLSSCLGRIGIRGGRFELEGTRNPEREIIWWSLKPVYRVACRGPLLQLLLLVKSFQRVVSQKKRPIIRADSFFSRWFTTLSPQNFTFEKAFIFLTIFKPPALILSFVIPAIGRRIFTNYPKDGWLEYVRKRYFLFNQSVILRGRDILKEFTLPPPQDNSLIKSACVYAPIIPQAAQDQYEGSSYWVILNTRRNFQ